MKDYCECCGNNENLIESKEEKRDRSVFIITICSKCFKDVKTYKF